MKTLTTKTRFSIITFFDPYGDLKSTRRQFDRKNYASEKPESEVRAILERYSNGKYYNGVQFAAFDNRSKKVANFDTSNYINGRACSAEYVSIPGN